MPGEQTATALDVERIAFVTRRYEALRGLSHAAYGAALLFAGLSLHFLLLFVCAAALAVESSADGHAGDATISHESTDADTV